ncbi:right-handed parallel beta-helix repeat-containing protein [Ruegeria meonggei]|uniref:right-handed parallel beta-helix repeat-containing protein n=1 Tax=Ruegeria meonggei TaxID=1446476 RepID=UPI00366F4D32
MRSTYISVGILFCSILLLMAPATPLLAAPACSGANTASETLNDQIIQNAKNLSEALRTAGGGEIIVLAGGNYGALNIKAAFKTPVSIRSADPSSPACFTELRLNGAGNLTLDGLMFDYSYKPGDKNRVNHFSIRNSHKITISNSVFDGDYKAGIGHGRGLLIRDSSKVTISNSVFRKWWKALTGVHSTYLTIRRNQFYDIRADGMIFSGMDDLVIELNRMHNFRASTSRDHRDMIQLIRSTNRGSSNIVIRDNIFDIGAGDYTQTIFMGKSGKNTNDPLLRHKNVLIENNVIYNAHLHGISIHAADNLSIRKNSIIRVRQANDGKVTIPRINVSASTYVVIEQNVVGAINGYQNQKDWAVLNNAIVQDQSPSKPGYYDREFIYYATGAANGFHEYGVRPGSEIDRLNAGSTLVKNYPTRR